ncbi:MAG TPA: hypothetical protein VIL27_04090 [Clostridia bacterium]
MKLEGTLYWENRPVARQTREIPDEGKSFVFNLDRCLLALCKDLEIPLPVWMGKNTREFAAYHQTVFFKEQFSETVLFDRLQIRMTE